MRGYIACCLKEANESARRAPARERGRALTALLGDDPALEPLKRLLVRRGNPFFIEERLVILAARIDRLPAEDKQLLQTASVIGKDIFPWRTPSGRVSAPACRRHRIGVMGIERPNRC
jgi:hypothetical protein